MISTSDGSRAKAFFSAMDPKAGQILQSAIVAAISKTAALSGEAAALAASEVAKKLYSLSQEQQNVFANNAVKAISDNVTVIECTALDAAADALAKSKVEGIDIAAVIAAGTAVAVAGGASIPKLRRAAYRAGSVLGDVEAIASGDPKKIVRRGVQHTFWRSFGRVGRSIFRGIGGR
jgi:hypothetical protein